MVRGAFIPGLRRKYLAHEYNSAIFLVIGLILFTLADAQTSPNFTVIGVVMVSGALVIDSFLGNLQEAIFTMNPETTQMEMLFFNCSWAAHVNTTYGVNWTVIQSMKFLVPSFYNQYMLRSFFGRNLIPIALGVSPDAETFPGIGRHTGVYRIFLNWHGGDSMAYNV